MQFENFFTFEGPEIPREHVLELSTGYLNDIYVKSTEVNGLNVFFHLINELIYLEELKAAEEAAHICYLISYYIFISLTPPHSESIAMEYAKKQLATMIFPNTMNG